MSEKQRTLAEAVSFKGVGLHTGKEVTLEVVPAPDNHGYKFQRVDLDGEPLIKADCDLVVATDRGTTLEQNGARVYTTEHILAALYGCQVDNALIKLNGPEIPIMDGSAEVFVKEFDRVGYVDQNAERTYLELDENIKWEDTEKGIEILAVPDAHHRVTVMVDYQSPVLGTQHASMYNLSEFRKEISTCRTFVFLRELEFLAKNNLIKGGDLDNAIVLVEREDVNPEELRKLAKLLGKEDMDIKVEGMGVLNSTKLKFENEPARHKLLDILGDLALVGKPIKAHILAARPGHSGNVRFAKVLKEYMKAKSKPVKKFDLTKEPLYNITDIEEARWHDIKTDKERVFVELNMALLNSGFELSIPKNSKLKLHIQYQQISNSWENIRTVINVGENAQLDLTESYDYDCRINHVAIINAEKNSSIKLQSNKLLAKTAA